MDMPDEILSGGLLPITYYTETGWGGAPPKRGAFFRPDVYKRVGTLGPELRVGKTACQVNAHKS